MLNIKSELQKLNLTSENSVVIGSGVLNALKLRESSDIDVVVNSNTYDTLKASTKLRLENSFGMETLVNERFEISKGWNQINLKTIYPFTRLFRNSIIIDDVRYITPKFLLKVKQIWASSDKIPREKDLKDIILLKKYLQIN